MNSALEWRNWNLHLKNHWTNSRLVLFPYLSDLLLLIYSLGFLQQIVQIILIFFFFVKKISLFGTFDWQFDQNQFSFFFYMTKSSF